MGIDHLRCRCGGWLPAGRVKSRQEVAKVGREMLSRLGRFTHDYAWAESFAHAVSLRGANGRSSVPSDPTGDAATDPRLADARRWWLLSARLLERALDDLQLADDAVGAARFAIEGDHDGPPVPYANTQVVPESRPDLVAPHAARKRRWARGEGIPS